MARKAAAAPLRRSSRLAGEAAPAASTTKAAAKAPKRAITTKAASTTKAAAKAPAGARRDASDATAAAAKALASKFEYAFGVDEVGRGCLAGPVVTCACYLPPGAEIEDLTDSKQLATEDLREAVYARLLATPGLRFALAKAEAPVVDELNILQANLQAMRTASEALCDRLAAGGERGGDLEVLDVATRDDDEDGADADDGARFLALVDGVDDPWRYRPRARRDRDLACRTIKKGDASVSAISAASVIAKVTRDRIMNALAGDYPEYDWASNKQRNKAYGTHAHRCAIVANGWVDGVHRETFDPVRSILAAGGANKRKPAAKKPAAKREAKPAAKKPTAKRARK
ncbi:RNA-DNA hybrid ribonuclease [Aureococcus anophagefferens]|uniref:Ribonuclease n=1 Tax=Aureococcus anophagefferens TaxID=44056 RepID=A0ABR1GEF3_AURAN